MFLTHPAIMFYNLNQRLRDVIIPAYTAGIDFRDSDYRRIPPRSDKDFFLNYLHQKEPASVKVCAMFNKPARRKVAVNIDYFGLTVPDAFLVGYGLDFDEKYRYLPALYRLED